MKGNHYFFDLLFFSVNYLSEGHLVTLWSQINVYANLCEELFHFRELSKFFLSFFLPKKCCRPSTTFSWWQKIVFVVALVLSTAIDSQKNFQQNPWKNKRSEQKNKILGLMKKSAFWRKIPLQKQENSIKFACYMLFIFTPNHFVLRI